MGVAEEQALLRAISGGAVRSALRNMIVAVSSEVSTGAIPGAGSGQNDTYTNRDNVDPTHPMVISYLIPSNSQRVIRALLSWRLHPYRTYNDFSVTGTGGQSVSHVHDAPTTNAESGHTHNHAHTIPISAGPFSNAIGWDAIGGNFKGGTGPGNTGNINSSGVGSSGHTHTAGNTGNNNVNHTHTIASTDVLGITEGASATTITLGFDGVDKTTLLGGPWSTDEVELDITPYIATLTIAEWHSISVGSATLGQIETHLRLSFFSSSAQGA